MNLLPEYEMLDYSATNILEHFEAIKKSKGNHFLLIDDLELIAFNKKYNFSGVKLLKNVLEPTTIPFAIVQCYFLRKSMEYRLKQMQVAGLIDHYMKEFANRKYLEMMEEGEGLKVLSLDHLGIGFEAFLAFIGLAAFAFLLEILWFNMKKLLLKL